jgi:hypothetical protein
VALPGAAGNVFRRLARLRERERRSEDKKKAESAACNVHVLQSR